MAASLQQHLSKIRSPLGGEKVYKDECAFSFDTPECESGLYICMSTFLGLGKKHVERYHHKTGNAVFLHLRRIKREIPEPEGEEVPKKKPTRLAIGVEGGFDANQMKYEVEEKNSVVVLPEWTVIPLPNTDLPGEIQISAASIIAVESAAKQEEAAALAGQWDGEKRLVSKHAENLLQLDNGKKIPPSGWKCEMCEKTDNLWLNLTDGTILCGRKFWDGSGGNNHAVEHFAAVKYPLAVKLGTINPDGGDVHSYDEDDMVEDPHIAKHLAHFGIDIMKMEKTDKTMVELEIDANQKIMEWDVIQEAGSKLEPVYGPGYTGIRNLGNSCYMNSVMQVIFTVPDFVQKYKDAAENIFNNVQDDPTSDFNVQMAKFGVGILSGDYSKPLPEATDEPAIIYPVGIRPQMFKTLIGRGHSEFSTKRQQDAQEFLLHLFNIVERHSRNAVNPTDSVKFEVEEKIECILSGRVKYTNRTDYMLALSIPMESATNLAEVAAYEAKKKQLEAEKKVIDPKDIVRPRISLQSCLDSFSAPEMVEDFYSTALQANSTVKKTTRLSTFPDFLFIQMKKFTLGEDWVPKKLDVSLDMPDELDLSALKGKGLQPGEELLPEANATAQQEPEIQIDEAVVAQLADMGFAVEGCKKAVFHTKNMGIEAAMNWVMEHMGDSDFSAPFQVPGAAAKKGASAFVPNEEAVVMIMSMGFTPEQATRALKATDNNVERAADWIFSHMGELDQPMETEQSQAGGEAAAAAASAAATGQFRDGNPKYKLVAFISHMGTSTLVGHYVCHILKEGRWVIFNDEKVALSANPPKDLAYIYLYKRV